MAIILDHQLREHMPHAGLSFPVTYFQNELAGGNLKTGLLAATVFLLILVFSLLILNKKSYKSAHI